MSNTMKKIIIASVVFVLVTVVLALILYRRPLNTVEALLNSEELTEIKTYRYKGNTFYPDEKAGWKLKEGELTQEELQKIQNKREEISKARINELNGKTVPENKEDMEALWPQKSESYGRWEVFFLIMSVEFPEYYFMPREVFLEEVRTKNFYEKAVKVYRTKKLNAFQKEIFKKAIHNLSIIQLDV